VKRKRPLGCDAAFSPVVDPQYAHVFGRCISYARFSLAAARRGPSLTGQAPIASALASGSAGAERRSGKIAGTGGKSGGQQPIYTAALGVEPKRAKRSMRNVAPLRRAPCSGTLSDSRR
jgi:hypothetical protein